jgi:predicted NUDIX family NTP pyrophosphohydrolase
MPLAAARREFAEETGYRPRGKALALGEARQPGGKIVHVWAVEDDWDAAKLRSNSFEMEWPPNQGSGRSFRSSTGRYGSRLRRRAGKS